MACQAVLMSIRFQDCETWTCHSFNITCPGSLSLVSLTVHLQHNMLLSDRYQRSLGKEPLGLKISLANSAHRACAMRKQGFLRLVLRLTEAGRQQARCSWTQSASWVREARKPALWSSVTRGKPRDGPAAWHTADSCRPPLQE